MVLQNSVNYLPGDTVSHGPAALCELLAWWHCHMVLQHSANYSPGDTVSHPSSHAMSALPSYNQSQRHYSVTTFHGTALVWRF